MPDETAGSRYVEKRAPDAPDEIKAKAAARLDKYLDDENYEHSFLARVPHGAYSRSGAAQLLAPWVTPRLGIVGADDD